MDYNGIELELITFFVIYKRAKTFYFEFGWISKSTYYQSVM